MYILQKEITINFVTSPLLVITPSGITERTRCQKIAKMFPLLKVDQCPADWPVYGPADFGISTNYYKPIPVFDKVYFKVLDGESERIANKRRTYGITYKVAQWFGGFFKKK